MSDQPISLVMEHVRAIRADLAILREDVREVKIRQGDMSRSLAAIRRDPANDAETSAHVQVRFDRLREEMDRIKRRLDLSDA
jgi:hypothetical protein